MPAKPTPPPAVAYRAAPFALALALALAGCGQATPAGEPATSSPATQAQAAASPAPGSMQVSAAERADLDRLGFFGGSECPGADVGDELIGTTVPEWQLDEWVNSAPLALGDLRDRVVVVRFWMAPGCPFCEKSMPALQTLADAFADRPVTFVGAFHSKPAGATPDMKGPAATARDWGVTFPLAFDREWKTLRAWWLTPGRHRHATSVTFVLGRDGKVAFVHPGPEFYPSDDPASAQQNLDYQAVKRAIEQALAQG